MTTIDSSGFHRSRLDERVANLVSAMQAIFGTDIDVSPESPDGQMLGIFAEAVSDLDQLAETIFNGRSPSGAQGAGLSRLALLNGVTRKGPQYSTTSIVVTGTIGTVVPAGSLIATDALLPLVPLATFQTTTDLTLVDDGGHVVGTATGQVRASVTGPVHGAAGRINVIKTVISGWTGASNPSSATLGSDVETDADLRTRRRASVALPSQGILDGLYAALSQLPTVAHVALHENSTDAIIPLKGGTLAPHAIQAILDGGLDADIASTLWLKKSLGVTMVGATTGVVTDSQGNPQTMRWDTPGEVDIYVTVTLGTAVSGPTKTDIRNAIVAWGGANSQIGQDVPWYQLAVPINEIPGLNVASVTLGRAPSPTGTVNLTINFDEMPSWASANVVVLP
jgi:uncharacterized phage protein gp47/JayE